MMLFGCQTLQLEDPHLVRYEPEVVDGGDSGRMRAFDEEVSPPIEEAWRYNAMAGFGPGAPLIYGEAVVVGNRNGELHALGLADGKRIGMRTIGESLEGPLLIRDQRVYVTNAWGKYVLTAYDLIKGERLWRIRGVPIESAPVWAGGNVIAVDAEGNVRAVAPQNGEEVWTVSLGPGSSGETSPLAVGESRVLAISDGGRAVLMDARTGSEIWRRELGYPVYASPSISGERLLVPTTRGKFFALSVQDGSVLWSFDVGNARVRMSPAATDGKVVYFGASNGSLFELDVLSGSVRWRFDAPDAIVAPPVISAGILYVGTMGRMLYAFDRAREDLVWQKELNGRIKSGMSVGDGYLVILTEPRYVYAFRTGELDASRP
jgi:outer membrane protein assembly factor BamB